MGEDIHQRIYLKRRKDGAYVNAHEVCSWQPYESSPFAELVPGRNYDVFSLFGSGRGNYYPPLPSAKYGLPPFLEGSDLDEYCKECGFYGFVWFKPAELERDLSEFTEKLRDPLKFYDANSDEYAEWANLRAPGQKTAEQMEELHRMYDAWRDEHGFMMMRAEELLEKVRRFTGRFCRADEDPPSAKEYKEYDGNGVGDDRQRSWTASMPYSKMYDMDESVFLFFFDC